MDTTAAAKQAGVTRDTIRHWCRMGAIRATKKAGRWVIDEASLTYRISLSKKKKGPTVDLEATYTYDRPGFPEPVTLTPQVRTRNPKGGGTLTSIRNLAPLLADKINAIPEEGDRLHTLEVMGTANIVIGTESRNIGDSMISARDEGRIVTTYQGTRHISVEDVLDLGEQLRTHLNL